MGMRKPVAMLRKLPRHLCPLFRRSLNLSKKHQRRKRKKKSRLLQRLRLSAKTNLQCLWGTKIPIRTTKNKLVACASRASRHVLAIVALWALVTQGCRACHSISWSAFGRAVCNCSPGEIIHEHHRHSYESYGNRFNTADGKDILHL